MTVRLTEETDVLVMLGRPEGYDHAAVFHDSRLRCPEASVDCGAVLEVWEDEAEADSRSEFIKAHESGTEFLGTQHVHVDDQMLLSVSGELSKKQSEKYAAALRG